jgi:hypothetical protein
MEFPAASAEKAVVEYDLEVAEIHPALPGLTENPLYDGYRRNFLNLLQMNPRIKTLANNSSSDVCGFCFWQYSELARQAPPLADGLTALDLIRVSMERIFDGGLSYGQVGYVATPENPDVAPWLSPYDSIDTLPSFLIASGQYITGSGDWAWAAAHFERLLTMGRTMLAEDTDHDGLIKYPLSGNAGSWRVKTNRPRPANWWDTIGFGHEDAYGNALAFRACELMSEVSRNLGRENEAREFAQAAQRIKAAYYPTFYNPETGVLAGWKSQDGKLHDYWFTFVNGMAISFGLVEQREANAIMDRMLAKMKSVGFDRFDLGLPGNLIPVRQEDYREDEQRFGGSKNADGSDGFGFYENGAATPCHAYWFVKALYKLGRIEDARRVYYPMLRAYREGTFQGFGENGMSRDWRDWKGVCSGYEGFLCDGYLGLLAVEDDVRAGTRK